MRINTSKTKKAGAFTLIEMIGVLAVIAILASFLIPKVFNAINDARINSAIVGAETVKTAVVDHYGKWGRFDSSNGVVIATFTTPVDGYDTNILMGESLLDKPYATKAGTNNWVRVAACPAGTIVVDGTSTKGYNLSGNAGGLNEATGTYFVEAVIQGVAEADAQAISQRIDGPTLSVTTGATADTRGRVMYAAPVSAGGACEVHIYLAHR